MNTTPPNPLIETVGEPPKQQLIYWQKALLWHSLGFLTVVVLTWCDAILDLGHYFSGKAQHPEAFTETASKTVILILLWMFSSYKLYKIISRLSYLEKFMHVCAWCRRIELEDRWLTLEEHFVKQTGGKTTHGICPECSSQFRKSEAG